MPNEWMNEWMFFSQQTDTAYTAHRGPAGMQPAWLLADRDSAAGFHDLIMVQLFSSGVKRSLFLFFWKTIMRFCFVNYSFILPPVSGYSRPFKRVFKVSMQSPGPPPPHPPPCQVQHLVVQLPLPLHHLSAVFFNQIVWTRYVSVPVFSPGVPASFCLWPFASIDRPHEPADSDTAACQDACLMKTIKSLRSVSVVAPRIYTSRSLPLVVIENGEAS